MKWPKFAGFERRQGPSKRMKYMSATGKAVLEKFGIVGVVIRRKESGTKMLTKTCNNPNWESTESHCTAASLGEGMGDRTIRDSASPSILTRVPQGLPDGLQVCITKHHRPLDNNDI